MNFKFIEKLKELLHNDFDFSIYYLNDILILMSNKFDNIMIRFDENRIIISNSVDVIYESNYFDFNYNAVMKSISNSNLGCSLISIKL